MHGTVAHVARALARARATTKRSGPKPSIFLDLLAPIYGWVTEGFDTPGLVEAKALLDELAITD
jgi:hypothetical protein